MRRFHPQQTGSVLIGQPITPAGARQVIEEVIAPAHFLAIPPLKLTWDPIDEEISWEIFHGRLLDPAHTREREAFLAWNIHAVSEQRSDEPIVAIKLDRAKGLLHVVRGLECHVWEGYSSPDAGNVYLSRERQKWVRELVGTIDLAHLTDLEALRDELMALLFHAVIGVSRLPLTSLEAPLPAFALGRLLYCHREGVTPTEGPLTTWQGLLQQMLPRAVTLRERARILEVFLRGVSAEDLSSACDPLMAHLDRAQLLWLLRALYNEVSLSPWTPLVERTLQLLKLLLERGDLASQEVVDFLGWLLRQQARHLTAYDLVTFHHRGANYPDALLLDLVIKEYLRLLEIHPDLGTGSNPEARCRRRALRQGWLFRRRHEGHPVPDMPTSPGENARVLSADHPRVPEEQILQAARRRRLLFEGDPLLPYLGPHAADILRQSVHDLEQDEDLLELGLALFLDRPLGIGKAPTEPDQTPLLSALAFSRALALRQLDFLAKEDPLSDKSSLLDICRQRLLDLVVPGLPVEDRIGGGMRPGVVSLTDARLASADFVYLRSTASSIRELLTLFDFRPLWQNHPALEPLFSAPMLLAQAPTGNNLVLYDAHLSPVLELHVPTDHGYLTRCCLELPTPGLQVVRIASDPEPLTEPITLPLRNDPT